MLDLTNRAKKPMKEGWWLHDPASNKKAFGMILHLKRGVWVVARTLYRSPAERMGVVARDQLLAVDGYEVNHGKGDMSELYQLMQMDKSTSHEVAIRTRSGKVKLIMNKKPLRQLLRIDFWNGGGEGGYCIGCRTCVTRIIGVVECKTGCRKTCTIA